MGTGAVNGHTNPGLSDNPNPSQLPSGTHTSPHPSLNSSHPSTSSKGNNHLCRTMKMSCEMCSTNFTLFKRKKFCQECHRYFCSTCLPKPPSSSPQGRQCRKCCLLISGQFTRDELQDWKVKDIRCFLDVRKVSTKGCREKHDLVDLVLTQFCKDRRNSFQHHAEHDLLVQQMAAHLIMEEAELTRQSGEASAVTDGDGSDNPSASTHQPSAPSSSNTTRENQRDDGDKDLPEASDFSTMNAEDLREFIESQGWQFLHSQGGDKEATQAPPPQPPSRCHLDDIHSIDEVEALSVRQVKELLVNNFVDYKGCCEKPELVQKVKQLWSDHQVNKLKAERIHEADELAAGGGFVAPPAIRKDEAASSEPDTALAPTAGAEASQPSTAADDIDDNPGPAIEHSALSASPSKAATIAAAAQQESLDSLCRVCMDALTDCILLECGHMVTCTACGKQLAECPICRQYISRVVRVFRS